MPAMSHFSSLNIRVSVFYGLGLVLRLILGLGL